MRLRSQACSSQERSRSSSTRSGCCWSASMRRTALIAFALGVLVLGTWVVVPLLAHKREFPAGVWVPWRGLGGPVDKLAPNWQICTAGVTAERHSGVAQLILKPYRKPAPRLRLTLAGGGYRARA